MNEYNRRNFLKSLSAVAAISLADNLFTKSIQGKTTILLPESRQLEMLVLGDSVMWGQGLKGNNKFSFQIADWLKSFLPENAEVNMTVKAHSGATIALDEDEFESSRYKPRNILKPYHGEVNISTPTIIDQVTQAQIDYKRARKNLTDVNLILLNGGINDMGAQNIIDPLTKKEHIRKSAEVHCYSSMLSLLGHTTRVFPNARIIVTGYFPLVSKKTDSGEPLRILLNVFGFGGFYDWIKKHFSVLLKPLKVLNPAHYVLGKLAEKSSVWTDSSNENLEKAVSSFNESDKFSIINGSKRQRVFFVKVPFADENSYAAGNSYLWGLEEFTKTNDELFEERETFCQEAIKELYNGFINKKSSFVICHRAGMFHPNIKGAKAYADAIKEKLQPMMPFADWV